MARAKRSKCSTSTRRGARPTLTWRGCVPMPEGLAANSVASFADGSLVATVLFMPGTTFADAVVDRKPTGAVFEWSPGKAGLRARSRHASCPPTTASRCRPMAARSTSRRRACRRSSRSRTAIPRGSSARRGRCRSRRTTCTSAPDGRLVTAGMANDVPECGGAPGPRARHREALAVPAADDRGGDRSRDDARHGDCNDGRRAPRFSNATMVLPVGNEAWIGTFSGDRIARAPLR